jgi:hypothetical protein
MAAFCRVIAGSFLPERNMAYFNEVVNEVAANYSSPHWRGSKIETGYQ